VLWARKAGASAVTIPQGCHALDLMGNLLPGPTVAPGEVPMYWVRE
jgi:hypothetical protein